MSTVSYFFLATGQRSGLKCCLNEHFFSRISDCWMGRGKPEGKKRFRQNGRMRQLENERSLTGALDAGLFRRENSPDAFHARTNTTLALSRSRSCRPPPAFISPSELARSSWRIYRYSQTTNTRARIFREDVRTVRIMFHSSRSSPTSAGTPIVSDTDSVKKKPYRIRPEAERGILVPVKQSKVSDLSCLITLDEYRYHQMPRSRRSNGSVIFFTNDRTCH